MIDVKQAVQAAENYARELFDADELRNLRLEEVEFSDNGLVVTPNVLTEVSNLVGQLSEPLRSRVMSALGRFAGQVTEQYVPSADAPTEPTFPRLGLADTSVLLTARRNIAVLTDDLPLYHRLSALDLHVVNFNHLRTGAVDA